MRDKIRLFYIYKNENGIMPAFAEFDSFFNLIKETTIPIGQNETKVSENSHYDKLEKSYFMHVYRLYKYDLKNVRVLDSDKKAIEIFLQNGGNFNEMYNGNYTFKKLTEQNFVLNNK